MELKDFLAKEVNESLHEFIRTNVFTATRNFIQRLKAFRKEIMFGHNSPLAIKDFSDKMEFQSRGAGHIHGAAWCDLKKISQNILQHCEIQDDEFDKDSEDASEDKLEDQFETTKNKEQDITNQETVLEMAFKKLRKCDKLDKDEKRALIGFAELSIRQYFTFHPPYSFRISTSQVIIYIAIFF